MAVPLIHRNDLRLCHSRAENAISREKMKSVVRENKSSCRFSCLAASSGTADLAFYGLFRRRPYRIRRVGVALRPQADSANQTEVTLAYDWSRVPPHHRDIEFPAVRPAAPGQLAETSGRAGRAGLRLAVRHLLREAEARAPQQPAGPRHGPRQAAVGPLRGLLENFSR